MALGSIAPMLLNRMQDQNMMSRQAQPKAAPAPKNVVKAQPAGRRTRGVNIDKSQPGGLQTGGWGTPEKAMPGGSNISGNTGMPNLGGIAEMFRGAMPGGNMARPTGPMAGVGPAAGALLNNPAFRAPLGPAGGGGGMERAMPGANIGMPGGNMATQIGQLVGGMRKPLPGGFTGGNMFPLGQNTGVVKPQMPGSSGWGSQMLFNGGRG